MVLDTVLILILVGTAEDMVHNRYRLLAARHYIIKGGTPVSYILGESYGNIE